MPNIITKSKINIFWALANKVWVSKLYAKKFDSVQAVFVTMCDGYELGISPIAACRELQVTSDGTKMPAKLQLGRARMAGIDHQWIELSIEKCTIELKAPNREPFRYTFTWQDAIRAGLVHKDNWKKYPVSMLAARCESNAIDLYCPEVLGAGVYDPDELGDEAEPDDLDDSVINMKLEAAVEEPPTLSAPQQEEQKPPSDPEKKEEQPEPVTEPAEQEEADEEIKAATPAAAVHDEDGVVPTAAWHDHLFFNGLSDQVMRLVETLRKEELPAKSFLFPFDYGPYVKGKSMEEASPESLEKFGVMLRGLINAPKNAKFIKANVQMLIAVCETHALKISAHHEAAE